jgi:hypothetical protein
MHAAQAHNVIEYRAFLLLISFFDETSKLAECSAACSLLRSGGVRRSQEAQKVTFAPSATGSGAAQ